MNTIPALSDLFMNLGLRLIGRSQRSPVIAMRRFRAHFGVSPLVCAHVWCALGPYLPARSDHRHLLFALLFLNAYQNEHVNAALCGVDEKTFRKYQWMYVELLATKLNVVSSCVTTTCVIPLLPVLVVACLAFDKSCFEYRFYVNDFLYVYLGVTSLTHQLHYSQIRLDRRFEGSNGNEIALVSLDGTDFRIQDPYPFDPKWYSHKFHGPGLRYEVALNIKTGSIVWVNGSVPCGEYSDLRLALESYVHYLDEDEKTVADRGYNNRHYFIYPDGTQIPLGLHARILARHETVNRRLKSWHVLGDRYRHSLDTHWFCFNAVANLVQMSMDLGEALFQV
jgi:hypothetical protein